MTAVYSTYYISKCEQSQVLKKQQCSRRSTLFGEPFIIITIISENKPNSSYECL